MAEERQFPARLEPVASAATANTHSRPHPDAGGRQP
jgi:hypothetical protein